MMRKFFVLFGALALAHGAIAAQDAPTAGGIDEDEWRSMAAGKTLTYAIDGEFFALEQYSESGNTVSIQLYDGQCMSGRWQVTDGAYCFFWEANAPVCFVHRRVGETIEVAQVIDGVETGAVQTMIGVSNAPLQCGALTS